MYIHELELNTYRNYERCHLQFSDRLNLCVGKNAQGKTNLIDLIGMKINDRKNSNREYEIVYKKTAYGID